MRRENVILAEVLRVFTDYSTREPTAEKFVWRVGRAFDLELSSASGGDARGPLAPRDRLALL